MQTAKSVDYVGHTVRMTYIGQERAMQMLFAMESHDLLHAACQ